MSLYILCVVSAICMAVDGLCPPGWTLFGDSCYDVVKDKEEWAEANYICEIHQGYMTVIESSAENDFVKGLIKTEVILASSNLLNLVVTGVTGDVWIGASDLWEEGVFRWAATNQKLNFSDWQAGEPNNANKEENCVEIGNLAAEYHWNDDTCTKTQSFICETSE